jgi:hypothetical protein
MDILRESTKMQGERVNNDSQQAEHELQQSNKELTMRERES